MERVRWLAGEEYKVKKGFGQAPPSARARVARIDATRKPTRTSTANTRLLESKHALRHAFANNRRNTAEKAPCETAQPLAVK